MAGPSKVSARHARTIPALPLQWKLMALVIMVILVSWFVAGVFIARDLSMQMDQLQGQRVLGVARIIASDPETRDAFRLDKPQEVLQPRAERWIEESGVDLLVIFDMETIRYAHPNPSLIGERFTGGDEGPSLQGEEYVSHATGVSGPSLRAFVPLYDESGRQLGVVVAGVWMEKLGVQIREQLIELFAFSLIGLAAGAFGAAAVAYNIKTSIFGLEPEQIGTLLEERTALLEGVREGIMAVDRNSRITVINREAERLLGIGQEAVGRQVTDIVPTSRLPEIVASGQPEFDQEQTIGNAVILTNRVPIAVDGRVVGAVATFRDMSEMRELASELTGVKQLAEALRAQAHEFVNRLHTVFGLLQLGKQEDALAYIASATQTHEEMVGYVAKRVHDPALAGLLLGKISAASERNVNLTLDPDSYVPGNDPWVSRVDRVTILGNLIQNAVDAVSPLPEERRTVWVTLYADDRELLLEVEDTGVGISGENLERIFERGFTTKEGSKGIGLSLVMNEVKRRGGRLEVDSRPGMGSRFSAHLPRNGALDRA